jgi:hypothetical protein
MTDRTEVERAERIRLLQERRGNGGHPATPRDPREQTGRRV